MFSKAPVNLRMRPTKKRLLQALFLACVAPVMNQALSKDATPASAADIKQAVEQVMREYNVPGVAIAITDHGRQTFYNFGVASKATRKPVTSDTLFEIGSISKTFTATLATYAQVLGRLSLNDSPTKYLPELRNSNLDKVSLINLGTHTAGGFPLQVPDEIKNREQLMAYFKAWTPQYAAGSARTYANPSIGLLGVVAAKAMDQPFKTAIQRQLFAKLGLHDSYYDVPAAKMASYAQGYNKADVPVRVNPGELADEAYGVKTTAKDLLHFLETNIDPSQVDDKLRRALGDTRIGYYKLGAMMQDLVWEQYDEPVQLNDLLDGNSNKVGSQTIPVQAITPPRPATQAAWVNKTGSTNGFGAYVAFVPEQQTGIVILANKNYPIEARVRLAYRIMGR
jgi:beta-lactamase class C